LELEVTAVYKGWGVHHIAIGVNDFEKEWAFYETVLHFTNVFVDFPAGEYPALTDVVRSPSPLYKAILFNQPAGGVIVELVRMINPVPRPIRKECRYGDIGLTKVTITTADVNRLYSEMAGHVEFCSPPKSASIPGWGEYCFVFCRDPEGNLIEFVSMEGLGRDETFGGVRSVGIAVSDLDRSMKFYRTHGGFDRTLIDVHDAFSGLVDEVSGCRNTKVRSCLLGSSEADGFVELFEVSDPRGRSIPFGATWGDFGYLQVCLNGRQGDDVFQMAAYFKEEGMEFMCTPQLMGDEKQGAFFYGKDPDGIPMEFLVFLK
jgi:catechol 2,3-dioxygenase-like lactoylglutathione lyase family enzyme